MDAFQMRGQPPSNSELGPEGVSSDHPMCYTVTVLAGKMKGIWRRGVHQPSFVLALYNHTQRVDAKWNMGQLGCAT
eukprot:3123043-Pyramimonas_sp.AAC.1